MQGDMTKGSPVKLILAFAIPLFIGNAFQQLYSMADTFIVGRTISPQALAAVGATGSITFLVLGFVQGLTSGFSVMVAQRFGASDDKGVRTAVAAAVQLSVIAIAVLTTVSISLTRWVLELMNTPHDIIEDSYSYLIIIFAGIIGIMFYNLVANVIRALGDSRTPLVFLVVACIINILLDILFIVGFKMGVSGAAYATVIAQVISGVLCLIYAIKRYPILRITLKELTHFDKSFLLNELRIGCPMGFQFSITAVGVMIIQTVLNGLGSDTVAGFTAAARIGDLAGLPLSSLGVAMATYAAQNYGAQKLHRVREGVNRALIISFVFSAVGGLTLYFFGNTLVRFFFTSDNPAEIEMLASIGATYLKVICPALFVLGILFILRNTLQGIGLGFVPMMAGASELLMRALVGFTVAGSLGYVGVCLAEPIAWIGGTIPLVIRYLMLVHQLKRKEKTVALNEV